MNVLLLGDTLTKGVTTSRRSSPDGADEEGGAQGTCFPYGEHLDGRPGLKHVEIQCLNERTVHLEDRLVEQLEKRDYHVVAVWGGGYDSIMGTDPNITFLRLKRVHEICHELDIFTLVMTLPDCEAPKDGMASPIHAFRAEVNDSLRKFARENAEMVVLVDIAAELPRTESNEHLWSDHMYLSRQGYARVAEMVLTSIVSASTRSSDKAIVKASGMLSRSLELPVGQRDCDEVTGHRRSTSLESGRHDKIKKSKKKKKDDDSAKKDKKKDRKKKKEKVDDSSGSDASGAENARSDGADDDAANPRNKSRAPSSRDSSSLRSQQLQKRSESPGSTKSLRIPFFSLTTSNEGPIQK